MNDDLNGRQSRDGPSRGEKPKSTRFFVATARPIPVICSIKNPYPFGQGFLIFCTDKPLGYSLSAKIPSPPFPLLLFLDTFPYVWYNEL